MDVLVLKAKPEDVLDIHKIEQECFSFPWTYDMLYIDIVNNVTADYFVAKDKNSQIVGFCGMHNVIGEAHITNIAVYSYLRKKGIGGRLISAMIKQAQKQRCEGITLEVRTTNNAAIRVYEKFGFKIEGIRKEYYAETKEDAYIMWLNFVKERSF